MNERNFSNQNSFAFLNDKHEMIGISDKNKLCHMHISGIDTKSKEAFLEDMVANDINNGKSVIVLDPTGYMIDNVMNKIATKRNDIYLLDASNIEFPFGINLLESYSKETSFKDMGKNSVLDFCGKLLNQLFAKSNDNNKIKEFLYNSCAAILEGRNQPTLLDVFLFIMSDTYKNKVIPLLTDKVLKFYWKEEYDFLKSKDPSFCERINEIKDKIKEFIDETMVSTLLLQKNSSINIKEIIDEGGVILCRLSKNDIGFENVQLLGNIFMFKIQMATRERAILPFEKKSPIYFYINQFDCFTQAIEGKKILAELLAEMRLYRVGLILNHQFIDQIIGNESMFLASAIFNNCGTIITFKSTQNDVAFLEKYLYNDGINNRYKSKDILNLKENEFIGLIMQEKGVQSEPILAETLPFQYSPNQKIKDSIMEISHSILKNTREETKMMIKETIKSIEYI